jgi:hypothetical protein
VSAHLASRLNAVMPGQARGGLHRYSSVIRAQHTHEFCGLWLGHEALHLAPASDTGAQRRAPSVGGALRVSIRWTQLPGSWSRFSFATGGLRRFRGIRRFAA